MRQHLVSVGAKDCRWDYFRGSGAGGQKKNKTASAVRCTHTESKAVGQASDTRSQLKNKQLAFGRMVRTPQFQKWLRIANAKATGKTVDLEKVVENEMRESNLRVEGKKDKKWIHLGD